MELNYILMIKLQCDYIRFTNRCEIFILAYYQMKQLLRRSKPPNDKRIYKVLPENTYRNKHPYLFVFSEKRAQKNDFS